MKHRPGWLVPTIALVVLLSGVGLWARSAWREVEARHHAGLRAYADGLFAAVGLFQDPRGRWLPVPPEHFSGALDRLIRGSSSLRFAVMLEGGRRVAWAGSVPRSLRLRGARGERGDERLLTLWRTLQPPSRRRAGIAAHAGGQPQGAPPFPGPDEEDAPRPPGRWAGGPPPLMLVLGFSAPLPRSLRAQALWDIGLRAGAAIAVGLALLFAWIQVSRRRRLVAELAATEQARSHLEEISLAGAGLVHETKNPVGIIRGLAQRIAAEQALPAGTRERAAQIVDEADRTGARLGDFLAFARLGPPALAPVEVRPLLVRVAAVLDEEFEDAEVRLEVEAGPGWIRADEDQLVRGVLNLLLNALEACAPGAQVTLRFRPEGTRAALEVQDTGRGISPELLPDVLKPYVSGSPSGSGLGLAMVKRLATRHGWRVTVESEVGEGTRVRIEGVTLLAASAEPSGSPSVEGVGSSPAPQGGASNPEEGVSAPQEGVSAPQEGVSAPQGGASAPQEGVSAPQEGVSAPQEGVSAPQEGVSAPQEG